ncbi:hypothetical protein H2200_013597 [Cladophialophora chaetospira]|uniref:Zn(2)-C6 fungal-type domain-containing protein n=1 Tax=Cladophialophora chaetospira TaxID=386627 RepID=A0AA38WP90_9EURO|nr:hypothetical protein H2200_013597 [Cladophialophora chaetospira]
MPKIANKNCDETLPTCGRCERSGRWCDRTIPLKIRAVQRSTRSHDQKDVDETEPGFAIAVGEPSVELQSEEIAQCFEHYLRVLSPWYDLNDLDNNFRRVVGKRALWNSLLFSAVIAFAAIHQSKTGRAALKTLAESYHTCCLRLLIGLDEADAAIVNGTALAATCLLRSYEILAEEEDPNRHLYGAFSLMPPLSSTIPRDPFLRAGLWNYLREDITFSLINECPLKVDVGQVDLDLGRDDDHANQITLLLASLINAESADSGGPLGELRMAIEHWRSHLPFQAYHESDGGTFPRIQMVQECHGKSTTLI